MRMRSFVSAVLLTLSVLCLAGCDYISAIPQLMPSFDTRLPNIFSGRYAYYENEDDEEAKRYTELLEFDNLEKTFIRNAAGEAARKGTFSYSYNEFNITQCSGYLTLHYDDGDNVTYGFLYQASATDGPVSITLRQNDTDRLYLYEY